MSFDEYRRHTKTDEEGKDTIDIVRNHLARKAPEGAHLMGVVEPPGRPVDMALVNQEPVLASFLRIRNLSVETCQRYGARWGGYGGEWGLRLILPVYDDRGRCVSWQGRLVSSGDGLRYKTMVGVNITELLYSTGDTTDGRVYIVEGIFDAWRSAPGSRATFSKAIEPAQQRRLVAGKYNEIVFAWDADAYAEAIKAARELAPLVPRAGVVRLPGDEDPDTLGREALLALPVLWV
jgi:hypothetical protein